MIIGTDGAFEELRESLTELQGDQFRQELAVAVGKEIENQINIGFSNGTDAYGEAWIPRDREYGWPMLLKTLQLVGSFVVEPTPHGVSVSNTVVYFPFHQYGTKFLDARPMLPFGRDLGNWFEPLSDVMGGVVLRTLGYA